MKWRRCRLVWSAATCLKVEIRSAARLRFLSSMVTASAVWLTCKASPLRVSPWLAARPNCSTSERSVVATSTLLPMGVLSSWATPATMRPRAACFSERSSSSWVLCSDAMASVSSWLALLELATLEEVDPDGHEGFRECRRLDQAQTLGQLQRRALVGHGVLGIAAARDQGADLVADGKAAGGAAKGDDLPRDFQPRDIGSTGRRVVQALALQNVRAIHTGGQDTHQHFTGTGFRRRPLRWHQDLGATRPGDLDSGHMLGDRGVEFTHAGFLGRRTWRVGSRSGCSSW